MSIALSSVATAAAAAAAAGVAARGVHRVAGRALCGGRTVCVVQLGWHVLHRRRDRADDPLAKILQQQQQQQQQQCVANTTDYRTAQGYKVRRQVVFIKGGVS